MVPHDVCPVHGAVIVSIWYLQRQGAKRQPALDRCRVVDGGQTEHHLSPKLSRRLLEFPHTIPSTTGTPLHLTGSLSPDAPNTVSDLGASTRTSTRT